MNRNTVVALLALCSGLASAVVGCTNRGVGGGAGGAGGSQPTSTTGSGTNPPPGASGNARPAEGGYLVTLANYPSACGDLSIQPNCGPTVWWSIKLALPTADLVPGSVHPFSAFQGFFSEQLAGQSDCVNAANSLPLGTVKIVSASAAALVLEVAGATAPSTGTFIFQPAVVDGTYTVPICDGPTPVNDGKAIAMKFAETPNENGNSTAAVTGGPFVDPETLMLFVSNLGQSCTDPYHNQQACITPRYQIAIQLPVALQAVGSYPLGGMASVLRTHPDQSFLPGSCTGGYFPETYSGDTINITAIDSTSVTFTLSGTGDVGFGQGNADGTYTAPRCF